MTLSLLRIRHALNAALLDAISTREPLKPRIQAVSNFERLARYKAAVFFHVRWHATLIWAELVLFLQIAVEAHGAGLSWGGKEWHDGSSGIWEPEG